LAVYERERVDKVKYRVESLMFAHNTREYDISKVLREYR